MNSGLKLIMKDIDELYKKELDKAGIFYRSFYRVKDAYSITNKIKHKGSYSINGKKMQDAFGYRIITYFYDDLQIILKHFKRKFDFVDETIDIPNLTEFKPKRTNLIFKLPQSCLEVFEESISILPKEYNKLIDNTLELQLRTIFSEGWHEIDHSLRYKTPENWIGLTEEERIFNGIFASLETNDHFLIKLFDDIAHCHYKSNSIESLIRTKFRINLGPEKINEPLKNILLDQKMTQKDIYKLDRSEVITRLIKCSNSIDLNINTFIFFINHHWIKDTYIRDLCPTIISDDFN